MSIEKGARGAVKSSLFKERMRAASTGRGGRLLRIVELTCVGSPRLLSRGLRHARFTFRQVGASSLRPPSWNRCYLERL